MFRGYIGDKSQEQSVIFVDYRLHYFCTELYLFESYTSEASSDTDSTNESDEEQFEWPQNTEW